MGGMSDLCFFLSYSESLLVAAVSVSFGMGVFCSGGMDDRLLKGYSKRKTNILFIYLFIMECFSF